MNDHTTLHATLPAHVTLAPYDDTCERCRQMGRPKPDACGSQAIVAGFLRTCVLGAGHAGFHQTRTLSLAATDGFGMYVWTADQSFTSRAV